MITRVIHWFSERSSFPDWLKTQFFHSIIDDTWCRIVGKCLLFLLLLQFITGCTILFFYVPSSPHAHTSLLYLIKEVPCGAILRALHHQSANGLIILTLTYLLLLFWRAAYKNRRELLWFNAVLFLGLVLAACFTGQLLPWDQKGYYGTRVGASILGSLPIIGESAAQIFMGDHIISTLTLSRFFAVHVFLIPLIFIGLLFLRTFINANREVIVNISAYYPKQFVRETFAITTIFSIIFLISWRLGSPLEPAADPSDLNYLARPEWFFLPMFQLLKLFPASAEGILASLVALLAFGLVILIPFFDRSPSAQLNLRKLPLMILLGVGGGAVILAIIAIWSDRDPVVQRQLARQHEQAQQMLTEPFRPIPLGRVTGAPISENTVVPVVEETPVIKTFVGLCAPCHGTQGTGGALGPSLIAIQKKRKYTKEELVELIAQPASHGLTQAMPGFRQLSQKQREDLADLLINLNSPQKLSGDTGSNKTPPNAYAQNCVSCHGAQGEGGFGPKLLKIGNRRNKAELMQIMIDPKQAGLNNSMPSFSKLSDAEREEIADWLLLLE